MSEDNFERTCAICGSVVRLDSGSCRRCGYDLMDSPPDEEPLASRIAHGRPLASMRVYRRQIGIFLILFVSGSLLLAGGWALAYFGGVWRLSAPALAGDASLALFKSYAQCGRFVGGLQMLYPVFGSFASNASCSLYSLDSRGLTFAALGGASMRVGMVAFKKRFSSVGERISALWWALALVVPLIGGIVAYLSVREKNRTSAIGLVLLGIETLLGSALLYILIGSPLTAF
jgi:hypothetical protein